MPVMSASLQLVARSGLEIAEQRMWKYGIFLILSGKRPITKYPPFCSWENPRTFYGHVQ